MRFSIASVSVGIWLVLTSTVIPAQTPDLYDPNVIRTFKVTFSQSNWETLLRNNKISRTDIKADLEVDGITYKDVGVRYRGNTSYSYNVNRSKKLPINITTDSFVPGQRLYGYKNLNLTNAYKDATFIRETIAYELMRDYVPSLQCCFIKLVINGQNYGIYPHVQQPNRDFVDDWFRADDGNLYRGDSVKRNTRPTLTYLGSSIGPYQSQYDIKVANQTPWVDLVQLCFELNQPTAGLPQKLPDVLNVDNALWYVALQNIFSNTDSYLGTGNDYLTYHDLHHDRFLVMPWDLNTTFGGYDWRRLLGTQGLKTMSPYYRGSTRDPRPLITQLLAIPEWKERYLAHFRTMLAEFFDWKIIGPVATKYHKLIEPEVVIDTVKLYSTQKFYDNLIKDVQVSDRYGTYTIPGLKSFIDTKRAYLLAHADIAKPAPTISAVRMTPVSPRPTDSVWITARITAAVALGKATLYYRTIGRFLETEMFDDGQHRDGQPGDGVYGGEIPRTPAATLVQYYVGGRTAPANGGAMTFNPTKATFAPYQYRVLWGGTAPSALQLSELVAKNDTGIKDEQNEREDWLELVNTGQTPVGVSGKYLTDDITKPKKWQIPSGYTLTPGQTLLVWADEDLTQGPLHADFKLAAGGEELALFDTDGKTLLDWIPFGKQQPDTATGRHPLHFGPLVTFPNPTPRQMNRAEPCGHLDYTGRDATTARFTLAASGNPARGGRIAYAITGAPASTAGVMAIATAPYEGDVATLGTLLVHPVGAAFVPLATDNGGGFTLPLSIPNIGGLAGVSFYFQALVYDGTNGGLSNGVATRICP